MELYAFYQSIGQLLYEVYANPSYWEDGDVQNVGIAGSPAAILWNNDLHIFHQGTSGDLINPGNGQLWFSYSDGTNWHPDTQVPNVGMSESPSPVVYNGNLYVFHQGGYENGQLFYSVYVPGQGWQPDTQLPNVGMSGSPSAVSWPGADGQDLYVFHQGGNQNGELWYSAYLNGQGWQADTQLPNVGMSKSPSAIVYNGNLYVFHQGGYENGQLFYSVYVPGQGWQPDTQVPGVQMSPQGSPATVLWNNDLHVFYPAPDPADNIQGIGYSYFDGTNWYAGNAGNDSNVITTQNGDFDGPPSLIAY